jgi:CRISPR-associated endoribonuclease Cas6
VRLSIALQGKEIFIPFNYNTLIHAMILDKLNFADAEFASELHDSSSFKYFTFSEITAESLRADAERGGLEVKSPSVNVLVSSPRERFLSAFMSGLACQPNARIGDNLLSVSSVQVLPPAGFSSRQAVFRTLSPISASTMRERDGKLVSWDLLPDEAQFSENIKKNLIRKYVGFCGKPPADESLELRLLRPFRTRRIRIKNEFHVASRMVFEARGSPELLSFAYECGFGERNSMGFGMVEVVG